MALTIGKKEEVYGFKTLYREIGYYLYRLEKCERALKFFDEAVKKTPNDRRALLGRAYVRSKTRQYEGALDDIRQALNLDPDDLVMLAQKALNTYLSCEFEDGLVQNNRLIPKRKKPDFFVMGAMHCADAIENCIGERTGRPLRDHFKIIRTLAWRKNAEAQRPYEPKPKFKKKKESSGDKKIVTAHGPKQGTNKFKKLPSSVFQNKSGEDFVFDEEESIHESVYTRESAENIVPPPISFPFKPLQNYTSNLENYMADKYLDILYKDKLYLKTLDGRHGVNSPNKEGTKKIKKLARLGYKSVKYSQELLRARRPFYFIKYQEAKISDTLKARQDAQVRKMQDETRKEAQALVDKMRQGVRNRDLKLVLEMAEKLKLFCDSKSKKLLPERSNFLSILYDAVCQIYYDLKRLNKKQYEWDQEKRIHVMLGIELSREPSTDSVIGNLKGQFVDWSKQIEVYGDRLKRATKSTEMAWLYHELSRFHSELKQFELSRVYARKCLNEGKSCNDNRWVINALMLIMKNHILQHNKNEAKREARQAIGIATVMMDDDLKEFMEKTLQAIEKTEFFDIHGPKVLQKREKKIVEIMAADSMKDEAAHLFRMMAAMPAARRMVVMPGVKIEDETDKISNRRASIMPSQKMLEDLTMAARSKKKGKKGKKGDAEGVGFMEMIQYHID